MDADLSGPEEEREADDRMESAAIVAEDKGAYQADREAEHDRRVNNMSIRKVVAGLLITAGIAIMAVPFSGGQPEKNRQNSS